MNLLPSENTLKGAIQELLSDKKFESEITDELKESFDLYLSKEWQYFEHDQYIDKNFEVLFSAMNNFYFVLSKGYFRLKKQLLTYQDELLGLPEQPDSGFNMEVQNAG